MSESILVPADGLALSLFVAGRRLCGEMRCNAMRRGASRRRTIESAMVNAARERATDAAAAARTAERDELDSQRSSGPSDERIKTERRNPAAAFLRRRARSGAPPCIIKRTRISLVLLVEPRAQQHNRGVKPRGGGGGGGEREKRFRETATQHAERDSTD